MDKVILAFFLALVLEKAVMWVISIDTYTAEVETPSFLDTDNGATSKFVRVKVLDEDLWLMSAGDDRVMKLTVKDSFVPFFWAVDGDRAEGYEKGHVVCIVETGFRSPFLSRYPNLISIKSGKCQ